MNNGANPEIEDKNGLDAIDIATAFDQFRCLDLIRKKQKSNTFSKEDLNKSYDTIFYSFADSIKQSSINKIKKVDAQMQTSGGQFNSTHNTFSSAFNNSIGDFTNDEKENKSNESRSNDKHLVSASKVLDRHRKEFEKTKNQNSNFIQEYMNESLGKKVVLKQLRKDLSKSVNSKSIDRSTNKSIDYNKPSNSNYVTSRNVIKNLRDNFKNCVDDTSDESIEPFQDATISTVTLNENKELYIDNEFDITFINETKTGLNQFETDDSEINDSQLDEGLDLTLKNGDQNRSKFKINVNIEINKSLNANQSTSSYRSLELLDDDQLFCELIACGFKPGPVNSNTRSVYFKKLIELKKQNKFQNKSNKLNNEIEILNKSLNEKLTMQDSTLMFSRPLRELMQGKFNFQLARQIENEFIANFENQLSAKKQFFTYLLLDPRITQDLVNRAIEENPELISQLNSPSKFNAKPSSTKSNSNSFNLILFKLFILAIFYIGKGVGNRPYSHLYDAAKLDQIKSTKKSNIKKLNKIQEIWLSNYGVISLHCFHGISSSEGACFTYFT